MDANRKRYSNNSYVEGNTVRRIQELPDYEENDIRRRKSREEIQKENRQIARNKRRRQEKLQGIDLQSLLFLSAAIMLTLIVCIGYLQVQANITKVNKNIANLESQILESKNMNDAKQELIDSSLNLREIYKVATKELSMTYPKKSQIIKYEKVKGSYVRQYKNIPKEKSNNIVEKIADNIKE